jgi:hypothetical protein
VRVVHDAPRAPTLGRFLGRTGRAVLAVIAAAAVAGSLSACGDSEPSGAADEGARDSLGPVYLADCSDWNEATEEARLRTIRQIRQFAAGPVPSAGGGGAVIANDAAAQLFETTCANDYARGFKLYKLYSRGASLGGP